MDDHIQTSPRGESTLVDEVNTTQFYFSIKVSRLLFALAVFFGISAWMSEGIYSPQSAASAFKSELLSNPKILFWFSLYCVTFMVSAGFYLLVTIQNKLVLDVKNCTIVISYLFLRDKTIDFESLDSLLVFQDEHEPSLFGLRCQDKDQRRDKYLSKGICWRLAESQLAAFLQVIKKHRLDLGVSPWD
ncbi:hypothetical protein L3V43_13510 [Pseudoalteromonas sp. L23]|uniref:hypothetical protein n=1 Tax=unclassified Pseudoalteromonas TaxID=194690 RepID=UPI001EEFCAFA|nr:MULTISPECIES: hypothetical protein [unclassified Pseudoalteromonas]MCF7514552.1 hypothetical protein [Pseudoalteromonas sp. L7]MCF7526669.1 hypothetical protein [Pseudoalteromonas sp. L23]